MLKSHRKLDNQIIKALTQVCEDAKSDSQGFEWLTHTVDYRRFPQSLQVTLVFNEQVSEAVMLEEFRALIPDVQTALEPIIGAELPARQIEACREHLLQ